MTNQGKNAVDTLLAESFKELTLKQPIEKITIKEIADKADMIVNGYAFTRENDQIRILNLNNLDKALVISEDGKVLETTMDDIEIRIVLDYWNSDREFMEDEDA